MTNNQRYLVALCVVVVLVGGFIVWRTLAANPAKPTQAAPAGATPVTTTPPEQEGNAIPPANLPHGLAR